MNLYFSAHKGNREQNNTSGLFCSNTGQRPLNYNEESTNFSSITVGTILQKMYCIYCSADSRMNATNDLFSVLANNNGTGVLLLHALLLFEEHRVEQV